MADDAERAAQLRAYEFTSNQWPAWQVRFGTRSALRPVLAPAVFLIFLLLPAQRFAAGAHPLALKVAYLAAATVYAVSYVGVMFLRVRMDISRVARVRLVAWLFGWGIAVVLISGDVEAIPLLTYAIVVAALMLPLRYSRAIGVAVAVVQVLATYAVEGQVDWTGTATLVLVTIAVTSMLLLGNTIHSLREANKVIADLAVTEERSRFARDLHDLLGHSLTTMTVKSGLARRVLETGADPERAIAEVRDVEQLSRTALAEVRAAVSGYHQISLAAELVSAKAALRAANIEAVLPGSVEDLRQDLREPFAWVLREGVTNVVKHSGAARCEVRLGESWLEVRDDGTGGNPDTMVGNGLRGLRDRLRAAGADLEWGRANGMFTLRAAA